MISEMTIDMYRRSPVMRASASSHLFKDKLSDVVCFEKTLGRRGSILEGFYY